MGVGAARCPKLAACLAALQCSREAPSGVGQCLQKGLRPLESHFCLHPSPRRETVPGWVSAICVLSLGHSPVPV